MGKKEETIVEALIQEKRAKKYKKQHKKGEQTMKKVRMINWKKVIETAKTIALIMIFTAAIAFWAGVQYQKGHEKEITERVQKTAQIATTLKAK